MIKKTIENDDEGNTIEVIHVIPDNEIKNHSASTDCWCIPSLRYVNPNTFNELWIHNWQQ